jgi:WD40 repeat protein
LDHPGVGERQNPGAGCGGGDESRLSALSWSPDGRLIASGSHENAVRILSAESGATLRTLRGHSDRVSATIFSHDGTKVISGSEDKTVRVWRIFFADERRVRGLMGGLEVLEGEWETREVCCEVVARMKRLWEVGVVGVEAE